METGISKPRFAFPSKFFLKDQGFISLLVAILFIVQEIPVANGIFGKSRNTVFLEGDILLGAFIDVHDQPKQERASLLECGEIQEQYGIQRVEAAILTIDQINNDTELLPNITLGLEIRDSCWYSSIALEQSLEFIRYAINAPEERNSTEQSTCPRSQSTAHKNLVAVIGPGSSAVTIQVQNLLQLFRIPQVGYSATSQDLSDKNRFPYFTRVVPSDYYQAKVIVEILQHYNWTFVSTVHTEGNYGQSGINAFRELIKTRGICIAKENSLESTAGDEEYDQVITELAEDDRAKVVICFCEGLTMKNLLKAVVRLNLEGRFLFIASDGWARRPEMVKDVKEAAVGSLSVKIHSTNVKGFDEHFFNLNPAINDRNPWFKEFWEKKFSCRFSDTESNSTDEIKQCSGEEKLSRQNYLHDPKLSLLVKSIYAVAYSLHNLQKVICKDKFSACKELFNIDGSIFRDYLKKVTFTYEDDEVSFDQNGESPGRYSIINYQKLDDGNFKFIKVGSWNDGTFVMNNSLVVFAGSDNKPTISCCSLPCSMGQFKRFIPGNHTQKCCWICINCKDDEYLESETKCSKCGQDYWPNSTKTGCDLNPLEYTDWGHDEHIAALALATFGYLATLFTMCVFIRYNGTPVVKHSNRELTYIIFIGMMVSYLSSLPLLYAPTIISCALSRIMPGLSFSLIYTSLIMKTNRIYQIMNSREISECLKSKPQVVITLILTSLEACIIIFMLLLQPPEVVKWYPKPGKVVLTCNMTPLGDLAPMGLNFILIGICTLEAIKTRNLPENFNEAKRIGFSMYTTCVIWLAWLPIYFASNHKIISLSVCTSLSAFVPLAILYFYKIYIILWRPELNIRRNTSMTAPEFLNATYGSSVQAQDSTVNNWSILIAKLRNLPPHLCSLLKKFNFLGLLQKKKSIWTCSNEGLSNVSQHQDSSPITLRSHLEIAERYLGLEQQFGMNDLPVSIIRQEQERIVSRKKLLKEFEKSLNLWILKQLHKKIPISNSSILAKAEWLIMNEESLLPDLRLNKIRFGQFQNHWPYVKLIEESSPPECRTAHDFPDFLGTIIKKKGYCLQQVFNADETVLLWKKMPPKTFLSKMERTANDNHSVNDHVSLVLCANASGDCIVKPMVLYQSTTPVAIEENSKNLMFSIRSSSNNLWVTSALFRRWFIECFIPEVQGFLASQNLEFKVLLIVDRFPTHTNGLRFAHPNVEVIFLPRRSATLMQPMNQGVTLAFKYYYTRHLFKLILEVTTENPKQEAVVNCWNNFTIADCIPCIHDSLHELQDSLIRECWRKLFPEVVHENAVSLCINEALRDMVQMAHQIGGEGFEDLQPHDVEEVIQLSQGLVMTFEDLNEVLNKGDGGYCKFYDQH